MGFVTREAPTTVAAAPMATPALPPPAAPPRPAANTRLPQCKHLPAAHVETAMLDKAAAVPINTRKPLEWHATECSGGVVDYLATSFCFFENTSITLLDVPIPVPGCHMQRHLSVHVLVDHGRLSSHVQYIPQLERFFVEEGVMSWYWLLEYCLNPKCTSVESGM